MLDAQEHASSALELHSLCSFCTGREDRVLPRTPDPISAARMVRLSTIRVFEFSSYSLRSGAVVVPSDVSDGSGLLFLRGAPDVIRSLVRQESVPPDFDKVGPTHHSSPRPMLCHGTSRASNPAPEMKELARSSSVACLL